MDHHTHSTLVATLRIPLVASNLFSSTDHISYDRVRNKGV